MEEVLYDIRVRCKAKKAKFKSFEPESESEDDADEQGDEVAVIMPETRAATFPVRSDIAARLEALKKGLWGFEKGNEASLI